MKYGLGLRVAITLGVLCILMQTTNAQASLVTLHEGDSATFNFDLTGGGATVPFDSIEVSLRFSQASGELAFSAYASPDDPNNSVSPIQAGALSGTHPIVVIDNEEVVDGVFSFVVTRVDGNPVRILEATAKGLEATTGTTPNSPGPAAEETPESTAIPIPATLSLFALGLGLTFVAITRHRKSSP
jgi:hypothetical protein